MNLTALRKFVLVLNMIAVVLVGCADRELPADSTSSPDSAGSQIQFDRNGQQESIRATNGTETGMKWLSNKKDCLTIRPGEGYCRD